MKLYYLLVIFLLFAFGIQGQDLQISSGGKTKIIKAGTFIRLELPHPNDEPCDKCQRNTITGELLSNVDEKVKLKVEESYEPLLLENKNVGYIFKNYGSKTNQLTLDIPHNIIMSITKMGNKKLNKTPTLSGIGMGLMLIGMSHLISAPIAELGEDGSGGLLLLLGLPELVTGIILYSAIRHKTFITRESCPGRGVGEKIWELN